MEEYRSTFNQNQLISTATVACTAGIFTQLGEYRVLAGEQVAVGYGDGEFLTNAQGRIYALMNTSAPAEIPGVLRVVVMSATDRPYQIMWETRTEIIDANPTDRTKQTEFPLLNLFVTQDKRIALFFNPDTTATVALANTVIRLDITRVAL
jgi:hypothetical protein